MWQAVNPHWPKLSCLHWTRLAVAAACERKGGGGDGVHVLDIGAGSGLLSLMAVR